MFEFAGGSGGDRGLRGLDCWLCCTTSAAPPLVLRRVVVLAEKKALPPLVLLRAATGEPRKLGLRRHRAAFAGHSSRNTLDRLRRWQNNSNLWSGGPCLWRANRVAMEYLSAQRSTAYNTSS